MSLIFMLIGCFNSSLNDENPLELKLSEADDEGILEMVERSTATKYIKK